MEYRLDALGILLNIIALGVLLNFWPVVVNFSLGLNVHPLLSNFVIAAVALSAVHLASYIFVILLRHYNLVQ